MDPVADDQILRGPGGTTQLEAQIMPLNAGINNKEKWPSCAYGGSSECKCSWLRISTRAWIGWLSIGFECYRKTILRIDALHQK